MSTRKGLGTQQAVAKASGVDQKTVSRILGAKHEATLDKVSKLAKAFELDAWQLISPEFEPNNPPMLASQSDALRRLYSNLGKTKEAIEGVLGAGPDAGK